MQVEDYPQQRCRRNRTLSGKAQRAGVAIGQGLIDPAEIETTQLSLYEVEKAQGPVGLAAHSRRLKPRTVPGQIDIEPRMENLAQGIGDGWVVDTVKMYRDMAAPGVVAKHAGSQIPDRIAVSRDMRAIEAGAQRCGQEHREGITFIAALRQNLEGGHARASGGR
ncbi:hypothetical protein [Novosphingobium olei]|uniref:hypothetical protein n=1 Tax=Novosphingobium olei TaxID=2728851 RepID=UPI0030B8D6C7